MILTLSTPLIKKIGHLPPPLPPLKMVQKLVHKVVQKTVQKFSNSPKVHWSSPYFTRWPFTALCDNGIVPVKFIFAK